MTIVSIGEILWDVFPGSERLGGAPFNFSVHAARLGAGVAFVSGVGDDERGRKACDCAARLGLSPVYIQEIPGAPTGSVTVTLDAGGHPDYIIHRPAAYDRLSLDTVPLVALDPEWLYYGTLHQAHPEMRAATVRLAAALPNARRFYDVNLRRDCWTPPLVEELLRTSHVVKLNDEEAGCLDALFGHRSHSLAEFTGWWSERLGWQAVAVTRGAEGSAVRIGASYAEVPGYPVDVVDTVGAGDAFAAAFLHGVARGWSAVGTGDFANRLGALIASRPGAVPEWTEAELPVRA
jgi:fructokinase